MKVPLSGNLGTCNKDRRRPPAWKRRTRKMGTEAPKINNHYEEFQQKDNNTKKKSETSSDLFNKSKN